MSVLVIAEHDNAHLKGATLNTVAAAAKMGGDVHVLIAGSGDQDVDVTAHLCGSSHGIERCALEVGVVVFSNNQYGHDQTTFASFLSLSTRAATSATLTPALRAAGSLTLRVLRRGATSTPRSCGVTVSSCFFLAFMMLGSVT